MTSKSNKKITALFLAVLTVLLLAGCGSCEHDWQKATCQVPKTCSLCGETEGKVRSHSWVNTDCHAPEGCEFCGTQEGMVLTHTWQEDCKICVHCGLDERPADVRFAEKLVEGLVARWDLEAIPKRDKTYVVTKEDWQGYFDAEYNLLAAFLDEKFEDEALGEAAVKYIKSISAAQEALESFDTEQWEDRYYSSAYQDRTVALYQINLLQPITVEESYQNRLDNLLITGEVINMVTPLFDQIMFLHINTFGDSKMYETTVKNDTSLTFEWFSFEVNLLGEDGSVLETKTVKVYQWNPGEKKQFNFTTMEDVSAMDVTFADWKLVG